MAKKAGRRRPYKRFSTQEKRQILATAAKEGLTGEQVQKRFGIAQLTFYRWRGPVRGPAKARAAARAAAGSGRVAARVGRVNLGAVRAEVRAGIQRVLPDVIREEVAAYLNEILGPRRGPGRPRKVK